MPVEFEDDLGEALRRTADTFQPDDPAALVGAGHRTGRRLRRRRAATVVAGATALAAVAVGGVLAGGLAQGGGHGAGVAAAPERPTTAAKAKPEVVTGKQVADVLAALMPDGTLAHLTGTGTDRGATFASARGVYDDGHGPGEVSVVLQPEGSVGPCAPAGQDPGTWCSVTHVRGGTLGLYKGWEYPADHRGDVKDWTATFVTSAGAQVELSQWNSSSEKDAPKTRANPPLSVAEMTAIVTSPKWNKVLAALPDGLKAGTGKG
jgi:hypothetical protein